jgi:hypothetical protein
MGTKAMGIWIVAMALAACGGSQEQPTSSDDGVDPRLQQIMGFEEEIANAKQEIAGAGGDCQFTCRESGLICDRSDNICLVAEDMREPDSRGRCERSKTDCTEQKTLAQNRCGGCESVDTPGYAAPMD